MSSILLSCPLANSWPGYDAFIPHFKPDVFVLKYLGTVIFVANITWWKLTHRTTFWKATAIDLVTGRRQFEETETKEDASWNGGFWKGLAQKIRD